MWKVENSTKLIGASSYDTNIFSACGSLKSHIQFKDDGTLEAQLRLYPTRELKVYFNNGWYRWLSQEKNVVVFQKTASSNNIYAPRYSEKNFTLYIENVTSEDEGKYQVQCWIKQSPGPNDDAFRYSESVTLIIPQITTRLTTKGTIII